MPKKKDFNVKWNFYTSLTSKLDYVLALAKSGKQRQQSAGLRAMMDLYVNDPIVRDKVNAIIDDYAIYKQNGEISIN